MRTRGRFTSVVALAAAVLILLPSMALADDITHDIDASVGSMNLTAGGEDGTTVLSVITRNGDGKQGCNLTGSTVFTASVSSSNDSVATVSPSSVTFSSCEDHPALTVTPVAEGSATISLTQTRNTTSGTFDVLPARFTVNVAAAQARDNTTPVIASNVSGTLGKDGWYTSDVTVSWTVEDDESAITSSPCPATIIDSDTTGQEVTCSATSAGGTSSQSVTIKRDATPPVVTPGDVDDTTWRNTSRSQEFTASDAMSGLASSADAAFTLTASDQSPSSSQPTTDTRTVTDSAGNSTTRSLSALIDLTGPSIDDSSVVSGTVGANGWYTTAVTNRFVASDALSGLAGPIQIDVSTGASEGDAVTVSSGVVADLAGNSNPGISSAAFKIDLTDPTDLAFVGGPAEGSSHYFGGVPASPTCTANDAVSGLASCVVIGHSTAVGSHTLTATATDKAGRTATATRTYNVLAWNIGGLYKPVDMEGVWNTAKGGSTIPVKFEVFAGATELKETSAVSGLAAKKIACPGTTTEVSEIEMLASGSTTLRFDTTGDQFVYNWKTPTGAGCYELKVNTADGSSVTALFNLRK